jgi:hypothetical protein
VPAGPAADGSSVAGRLGTLVLGPYG